MDLPLFPLETFQGFLICLARVGSMATTLPVFGGGQTPMRIRLGLALILSLAVFPAVESSIPRHVLAPLELTLLVGQEILLGTLVGFIALLVFSAVELGGTIIGYQMGFAAANVYDPQTQRQNSLIAQFQGTLSILIFLVLDMHHILVRAMAHSYRLLPPGQMDLEGGAIPFVIRLSGQMFVLGVKLSAPILVVLLLSGLVLGVMARVFPQMNVFLLSFPLNIGLALVVLGLTFNLVAVLLNREFGALEERIGLLLQAL